MKQMWQVFQMTRRYDSTAQWLMLLGFLAPVLVGLALALWLGERQRPHDRALDRRRACSRACCSHC